MSEINQILKEKIDGLLYFSEYEYPLSFFDVTVTDETQLPEFIANYKNADPELVKEISPSIFFARFENYLSYNGPDEAMNENARRFIGLQEFLKDNFEKTLIYRIEKPREALKPFFIIAKAGDGSFTGLESVAVET